jgi:ribosomal protein S6
LNTYEVMIILPGTLMDEDQERTIGQVGREIEKLKGTVLDTEKLGKRTFARPLNRLQSGMYVRVGFTLDPASVSALLERLELNEEIFRVQVTRRPRVSPAAAAEAKKDTEEGKRDGESESRVSGG